ncbi:hypothetical protein, partial [Chitinophaga sp.]|uniref:hypothetical protein n=1 Tax=Chitinophaga sp. TaxID=1869181 RepID=UPI002F9422B2
VVPNDARYRTALHPDEIFQIKNLFLSGKFFGRKFSGCCREADQYAALEMKTYFEDFRYATTVLKIALKE